MSYQLIIHVSTSVPNCLICTVTAPSPINISTLSLHDALPILLDVVRVQKLLAGVEQGGIRVGQIDLQAQLVVGVPQRGDRKSTRLNSSHVAILYAVFFLKKKKQTGNISIND